MKMINSLSLSLLATSVLPAFLHSNQCYVEGATYQLNYDSILSTKLLHADSDDNPLLLSTLSDKIASEIGHSIHSLSKSSLEGIVDILNPTKMKQNCYTQETPENLSDTAVCNLYHFEENMSLQLFLVLSQKSDLVETMLDVKLTTPGSYGRTILTDILPTIHKSLQVETETIPPVWSIQARPSASELLALRQERSENEGISLDAQTSNYYDSLDDSSLETTILSNQFLFNKQLLAKVDDAEVWQYSKLGSKDVVSTSLYIDSKLSDTTEFAGVARAEAFVHPSLLSHPNPSAVAIVSDSPLTLMNEALKHKSVDLVVLYTSKEMETTIFPHLNDCSEHEECYDSEMVLLMDVDKMDIYEAPTDSNGEPIYFDALFYDGSDLSYENLKEMFDMVVDDPNSVIVINTGSTPSFDNVIHPNISDNDHRADYLRKSTKLESNGGYELGIAHVYDEPNAAPLDSTFILVTVGDAVTSKTYRRFMRRNPSPIDIDIAKSMYRSSSSYINTLFYDGPTHTSYLRPNRAWEYWFCNKLPWKEMPGCSVFLPKFLNEKYHVDKLDVVIDPVKGRTTKAMDDIPEGYILSPQDSAVSLFFDDEHYENLHEFVKSVPSAVLYKQMLSVIDGYGFQISSHGFGGFVCSTANNTFMNHACNEEQLNAGPLESLSLDEDGVSSYYFDPVQARRSESFGVHTFSYRSVKKGEEILMDYKHLRDSGEVRESEKGMCEGLGIIPIDQEKDPEVGHHRREEL